jgi:hypothetical protein
MTNEQRTAYIAGLIEERRAAELNGKPERVSAIDAELVAVGHAAATPAKRAAKRPAATAAKTEKR